MLWGISSALDLYEEYLRAFKIKDDPLPEDEHAREEAEEAAGDNTLNTLNILICGGADPRHVIKTLAKRYTHRIRPKLNIYLLDGCAEIEARNMLLLGVALEDPESFNLVSNGSNCRCRQLIRCLGHATLYYSIEYIEYSA